VPLENRSVVVYLSQGGFLQLNDLVGLEAEGQGFAAFVSEVDGFGVWLAIAGRVGERLLIVPWHFIRAIEVSRNVATSLKCGGPLVFNGDFA